MKLFSYVVLFWLLFGAGIPLLLWLMIDKPIAGYTILAVIFVTWFCVHHYIKRDKFPKKRRTLER
ncbi:hypothetical protein [Alkalicoccobacillus plakortidis]|uniref:Uncharacterized protein n=1 Tax=Alkalicoccobacillus plakortidis TaxID=444060 RepID=A0ABT0XJC5_9BACI|nr:hypothetical protein [Alkalicoccobacillus plakortidis]MCM2676006.1 hypothetical protein [Alkalicoccobacillus plakortidis]